MNVVYRNPTPETITPTVPGSVIAYGMRGASAFERAIMAARMHHDGVVVIDFTIAQLAALLGVSVR
jgi:hypothetical protein